MRMFPGFLLIAACALAACETPLPESSRSVDRESIRSTAELNQRVVMHELPALSESPEVLVEASWGEGEGEFSREHVGAQTGPMAIAADPEGGFVLLDTVGARAHRYAADGSLVETVETNVETADDVALGENGTLHLLVYERLPEPRYEIRSRSLAGEWSIIDVPREIDLPTALWLDGSRILIERRHGWLHSVDQTSSRAWGRPAGELELRVRLVDGMAQVEARHRTGQTEWQRELETPWPVTEILALEAGEQTIALVLRRIVDESDGGGQESWMVFFDREGRALGRVEVADARITDASRPYALGIDGALYELTTDETSVRVLRYGLGGAR